MRHKVLITGNNQIVVNEFFDRMEDAFECQYTSTREKDIKNHLKCFQPDFFVYALHEESDDTIKSMIPLHKKYISKICLFVIVGSPNQCKNFEKLAPDVADIVLVKPMTASAIQDKLLSLMSVNTQKEEGIKMLEEESKEQEAPAAPLKHILVVDDDPLILRVIKRDLDGEYEVATAINGKVALNFLSKKQTDLVLLDYNMPDEDGPSVLKKIHDNPATAKIPVVFLTGATEREKIAKALSLKPQGYMLKPIERDKLISTIKGIIG